jgi:putative transposase
VALDLSGGNASDAPAFDVLYASLDSENVLEAIVMDKGYDSDHIRQRLELDGIEPVIPPRSNRLCQYPYDQARYKQRNRIERFFCKLKHFRRIATRYDKLKTTFFSALCLVAVYVSLKNS